jgi:hypothetical protein
MNPSLLLDSFKKKILKKKKKKIKWKQTFACVLHPTKVSLQPRSYRDVKDY